MNYVVILMDCYAEFLQGFDCDDREEQRSERGTKCLCTMMSEPARRLLSETGRCNHFYPTSVHHSDARIVIRVMDIKMQTARYLTIGWQNAS